MESVVTRWAGRRVLVTGCTGLLGGWLVDELVSRGAYVVGLVRDWVPESRLLREGRLDRIVVVRGAVEDQATIERVLNEYEIEVVFHLAAQTLVATATRVPTATFEANIKGTWSVLEACRLAHFIKAVVVASSDKAYGDQTVLPYTESAPLQGRFPYDVSKSCADLIAQSYAASYNLPVVITRLGNLFGGGDLNFSRLVPGTIRSVLKQERPIIRSDGQYIRDYVYVRDGALAYLQAAAAVLEHGSRGEAYNFSYELKLTALQMVQLIQRLMGSELEPVILGQASNEIREQYLSSTMARTKLGWKPAYTLEDGLRETIAWYTVRLGEAVTA